LVYIGQPGGRAITFNYDAQNRVTRASLPDSHSVMYSYDNAGNLVSANTTCQRRPILRYAYNADHALTEVRDENGDAIESRSYDVYGACKTPRNQELPGLWQTTSILPTPDPPDGPEGLSQTMEYDQNYDPVRITDARTNTTSLSYNQYRDVISETDAEGRIAQHFYDYRGNRIASVRPNGRADVTLLDVNNNPISTFHANGGSNFTSRFDSEHVLLTGSLLPIPLTTPIANTTAAAT